MLVGQAWAARCRRLPPHQRRESGPEQALAVVLALEREESGPTCVALDLALGRRRGIWS